MKFKQWMEDLNTLHQNTAGGFDTDKRHNIVDSVGDPKMTVTPHPQTNELLVKAKVPSSDNKTAYDSSIMFKNVKYKDIPHGGQMHLGTYLITNPRTGVKYYIDQISTRGNDVQVNCTCPDFRNTFSRHNHNAGALLGEPDGVNGNRNRDKLPGMCKHLMRVVQKLMDRGILNTTEPTSGSDHVERPVVKVGNRARSPKASNSQGYLF